MKGDDAGVKFKTEQLLKDSKVLEFLEMRKSEIIKDLQQEFFFDALVPDQFNIGSTSIFDILNYEKPL